MTTDEKVGKILEDLQAFRAEVRQSFENQGKQIDELSVEVGAVKTRLGHVETVLTRVATKVAVPGVPALGGSGYPVAAKPRAE